MLPESADSEVAALVVSEMVSHALKDAVSTILLQVSRQCGRVRISVQDSNAVSLDPQPPDIGTAERRLPGLAAAALVDRGHYLTSSGKVTWAILNVAKRSDSRFGY
ncbi:hypothetical protein ACWGLF_41200 [Streptomyces puniciscabiei]